MSFVNTHKQCVRLSPCRLNYVQTVCLQCLYTCAHTYTPAMTMGAPFYCRRKQHFCAFPLYHPPYPFLMLIAWHAYTRSLLHRRVTRILSKFPPPPVLLSPVLWLSVELNYLQVRTAAGGSLPLSLLRPGKVAWLIHNLWHTSTQGRAGVCSPLFLPYPPPIPRFSPPTSPPKPRCWICLRIPLPVSYVGRAIYLA